MIYKKKNKVYNKRKITLGLVAARKGSSGLKDKNLIKIKNKEIAKTAINLAIKCKQIDNVILSTDSNKIYNFLTKFFNIILLLFYINILSNI